MVLPPSSALLWATAVGLGFCMAPLWPSAFTLAGEIVPLTAFASGLVLLGDSLGGMLLPSVAGSLIERAGPGLLYLTLPLLVFCSLVVCLLAYLSLIMLATRRARVSPEPTTSGPGAQEPPA